jgi:hypothetical protein
MSVFQKFFSKQSLTGLVVVAVASLMMLTVLPWLRGNGSVTAQENIVTKGNPIALLTARTEEPLAAFQVPGAAHTGSTTVVQLTPGGEPSIGATGFGQASAPAETATIQFVFSPVVRMGDLNPVIAALTAKGVRQQDIKINIVPPSCGLGGAEVLVNKVLVNILSGVSQQRILELVTAVEQAACNARLPISYTGVAYAINDCGPITQRALQAAINDARNRAQRLAIVLNVQLGDMQIAYDFSFQFPDGSQCNQSSFQQSGGFFPAFDPTAPAQVVVSASVQLAFAIR